MSFACEDRDVGSWTRHVGLRWAVIVTHRRPCGIDVTGSPSKPMGAPSALQSRILDRPRRPEPEELPGLGQGREDGAAPGRDRLQVHGDAASQGGPGCGYWRVAVTCMRVLGWVILAGRAALCARHRGRTRRRIWRVARDSCSHGREITTMACARYSRRGIGPPGWAWLASEITSVNAELLCPPMEVMVFLR